MKWIALSLGRKPTRLLLYPISAYFFLFSPSSRRASRDFLTRALDRPPSVRERFRHFFNFSATILDRVYLLTGQENLFDIRIQQPELVLGPADRQEGFILLGSHLGSFEVLRALGVNRKRLPLKVLLNVRHSPAIMRVLDALNPQIADTVIPLGEGNTALKVHETLAQGGIVGMLGDRVAENARTISCDFLGRTATFPTGPILLAVTLKVPVVVFFGLYLGANRYEIHFEQLFGGGSIPRNERDAAIEKLTRDYVALLERYARKSPYNWFNFYEFWPQP